MKKYILSIIMMSIWMGQDLAATNGFQQTLQRPSIDDQDDEFKADERALSKQAASLHGNAFQLNTAPFPRLYQWIDDLKKVKTDPSRANTLISEIPNIVKSWGGPSISNFLFIFLNKIKEKYQNGLGVFGKKKKSATFTLVSSVLKRARWEEIEDIQRELDDRGLVTPEIIYAINRRKKELMPSNPRVRQDDSRANDQAEEFKDSELADMNPHQEVLGGPAQSQDAPDYEFNLFEDVLPIESEDEHRHANGELHSSEWADPVRQAPPILQAPVRQAPVQNDAQENEDSDEEMNLSDSEEEYSSADHKNKNTPRN